MGPAGEGLKNMQDILVRLVDVPIARMFVLAAIIFLLVAVLGRIEGKIEPGKIGRIGATVVGILLMGSGLAMHLIDAEALRDKLRGDAPTPFSASARLSTDALNPAHGVSAVGGLMLQAVASQGVGVPGKAGMNEKSENLKSTIKVVSGTYGRNCGAKSGNATIHLARICDGQMACEYKIELTALDDAAPNCAKDFIAEWTCGDAGAVYAVSLRPSDAPGENLRLACR